MISDFNGLNGTTVRRGIITTETIMVPITVLVVITFEITHGIVVPITIKIVADDIDETTKEVIDGIMEAGVIAVEVIILLQILYVYVLLFEFII